MLNPLKREPLNHEIAKKIKCFIIMDSLLKYPTNLFKKQIICIIPYMTFNLYRISYICLFLKLLKMYCAIYFVSKTVCIKYYTLGIKGLKWSDMKIQICDTHFIHEHLSCFLLLLLQIPLLHKSWSLFENRVAKKLDLFSWQENHG